MHAFDWSKTKGTIIRLLQKPLESQSLSEQLSDVGVARDGILFVHSSLSSIGNIEGGVNGFLDALCTVKAQGTLAMPAHSWRAVNSGSRTFSVLDTPSCVGLTCETFRLLDGVKRSLHPTHSIAALGRDADWLSQGHEDAASPCGDGTPYEKLVEKSAQVLFVGTDLSSNTLFHTIETLAALPYALNAHAEKFEIRDSAGNQFEKSFYLHQQAVQRRFAETEASLVDSEVATIGMLGKAKTILIQASPFAEVMLQKIKNSPNYLLAVR